MRITHLLPAALLACAPPEAAQLPRIGVIDFYGVRKVSGNKLRAALGVRAGDPLPASKSALEERLEAISGVARARLQAVCCEDGGTILYVGIEEKGSPHFDYHYHPEYNVSLDPAILQAYRQFLEAYQKAAGSGEVAEDLSMGHALARDEKVRGFQEQFAAYAAGQLKELREVVRNSADDEQRAAAAYLIGYAEKKRLVVDDLQYALQDPSDGVRYNAMRSLVAIAALAAREPDLEIRVSPTWFIEMLNSILWDDRFRAATALVALTEDRNPRVLAQTAERALPAIIEMARWKHLRHALPAFLLAGRLAGLPEEEIQALWTKGEREVVIDRLVKMEKRKK